MVVFTVDTIKNSVCVPFAFKLYENRREYNQLGSLLFLPSELAEVL